jgi:hypothetical protein
MGSHRRLADINLKFASCQSHFKAGCRGAVIKYEDTINASGGLLPKAKTGWLIQ